MVELVAPLTAQVGALRDHAPGQMECDAAIIVLNKAVSDIEETCMVYIYAATSALLTPQSSTVGTLVPSTESSVQGFQVAALTLLTGLAYSFQERALELLNVLVDLVDAVLAGAKARVPTTIVC